MDPAGILFTLFLVWAAVFLLLAVVIRSHWQ